VHATPSPPHETLSPGIPGTLYPAFKPGVTDAREETRLPVLMTLPPI